MSDTISKVKWIKKKSTFDLIGPFMFISIPEFK